MLLPATAVQLQILEINPMLKENGEFVNGQAENKDVASHKVNSNNDT